MLTELTALAGTIHACAREKGWYDSDRKPPELIALMHSELSEALEAFRNGNPPDKHCPQFDSASVEFADCIIRILDAGEALNLRVPAALLEKVRFNWTRERRHGGKVY